MQQTNQTGDGANMDSRHNISRSTKCDSGDASVFRRRLYATTLDEGAHGYLAGLRWHHYIGIVVVTGAAATRQVESV
jgi:hypothetical protein